jgi:flagellar and swarming motility FlbD protein
VTLTTGQKFVVLESADEVMELIVRFRRSIVAGAVECPLRRLDIEQSTANKNVPDKING